MRQWDKLSSREGLEMVKNRLKIGLIANSNHLKVLEHVLLPPRKLLFFLYSLITVMEYWPQGQWNIYIFLGLNVFLGRE